MIPAIVIPDPIFKKIWDVPTYLPGIFVYLTERPMIMFQEWIHLGFVYTNARYIVGASIYQHQNRGTQKLILSKWRAQPYYTVQY